MHREQTSLVSDHPAPGVLTSPGEWGAFSPASSPPGALAQVAVGTFNLNNLFSRFYFRADVSTASASSVKVEERTSFTFDEPSGFKLRTYLGKLVKGKLAAERGLIAERITRMDLDVLAVQEVEDIDTLRHFARDGLGGLYRHIVLIEGNVAAHLGSPPETGHPVWSPALARTWRGLVIGGTNFQLY
jgi:hypothetical protein